MKAQKNQFRPLFSLLIVSILLVPTLNILVTAAAPAAPVQTFGTLSPGGFRNISQTLPINMVFVGYEQGAGPRDIDESALRSVLPSAYQAVNRVELLYGNRNYTGNSYSYNYNLVYANAAFEDAFFGYLSGISIPQPRTLCQDLYNVQLTKTGAVGQNHAIDAPSVEQWLANNAGAMLGVNTAQYTVFLVNWHGRPDFKFHVYRKTNEPST